MVNNYWPNNTGQTAGITAQQSPQHHQPQTPQTPTSIPDIIFTGNLNSSWSEICPYNWITRGLNIEFLGSDFSDVRSSEPFDDLLATEAAAQALREGLGSLDMDGFNMLADPDLLPLDPQAEDSFRLDRLDRLQWTFRFKICTTDLPTSWGNPNFSEWCSHPLIVASISQSIR